MKYLLLHRCACCRYNYINMETSRCRLADSVKEFHENAWWTCSTVTFRRYLCRCYRLCFSFLIGGFRNNDGKRHFKINICKVGTFLRLFHHLWILRCWWRTLQQDLTERCSSKYREVNNCHFRLTLSSKLQMGWAHVVVLKKTARNYSENRVTGLHWLLV